MKVHNGLFAAVGFNREDVTRAVGLHIGSGRIKRCFNTGKKRFGTFHKFCFGHNIVLS